VEDVEVGGDVEEVVFVPDDDEWLVVLTGLADDGFEVGPFGWFSWLFGVSSFISWHA
jgi:hypothetical protein